MRKYAYLKEPQACTGSGSVCKIMMYASEEGVSLFLYTDPDARICASDLFYESLEDLYEEWNGRIDERGWTEIDDPLPGCQHDAFVPLRVKGRNTGSPRWGEYEILRDGKWTDFDPVSD